jgi:hypothetical protein
MSARRTFIAAGALAAGLAASLSAAAGHATQTLAVSTHVSPSALVGFEVTAQPLEITAADLERGYVEVVMKSRVRVAGAEARPNVVMGIEPRPDLFKSMSVATAAPSGNGHSGNGNGHSGNGHSHGGNGNGNGNDAAHATPARIDAPAAPASAGHLAEFRYRFEFSKSAREGSYGTAISVAIDL